MPRTRGLRVAKRHGQGVGGISGLRASGKIENGFHHLLNLLLGSATESSDAGLYFPRRIAVRRNLGLCGGQQDDAAHFRELQGRPDIQRREHGFDGHGVRRELLDKPGNQEVDFAEADGESDACREP